MKKYDVFISYAGRLGSFWAKGLYELLTAQTRFKVAAFPFSSHGGNNWYAEREVALEAAKYVLVVITQESFTAQGSISEWYPALQNKRQRVIPLFIENAKVPRELNLIHYVDFRAIEITDEARILDDLLVAFNAPFNEYAAALEELTFSRDMLERFAYYESVGDDYPTDIAKLYFSEQLTLAEVNTFQRVLDGLIRSLALQSQGLQDGISVNLRMLQHGRSSVVVFAVSWLSELATALRDFDSIAIALLVNLASSAIWDELKAWQGSGVFGAMVRQNQKMEVVFPDERLPMMKLPANVTPPEQAKEFASEAIKHQKFILRLKFNDTEVTIVYEREAKPLPAPETLP